MLATPPIRPNSYCSCRSIWPAERSCSPSLVSFSPSSSLARKRRRLSTLASPPAMVSRFKSSFRMFQAKTESSWFRDPLRVSKARRWSNTSTPMMAKKPKILMPRATMSARPSARNCRPVRTAPLLPTIRYSKSRPPATTWRKTKLAKPSAMRLLKKPISNNG